MPFDSRVFLMTSPEFRAEDYGLAFSLIDLLLIFITILVIIYRRTIAQTSTKVYLPRG